jgi:hypothetical protein
MGAVLCCPEHTETDIWPQDIDEKLQGHNSITVTAAFCRHKGFNIEAMVEFRTLTRHNVRRTFQHEQGSVIHVTQTFAAGCRIVAA